MTSIYARTEPESVPGSRRSQSISRKLAHVIAYAGRAIVIGRNCSTRSSSKQMICMGFESCWSTESWVVTMVQFTRFTLGVSAPELESVMHHQFAAGLDSKITTFLLFAFFSLVSSCKFVLDRAELVAFC